MSAGTQGRRVHDDDVLLHGTLGDDEAFGDALIGAALSHQLKHLPFARSQLLDGFLVTATAEQLRHDRRVDREAALALALHGSSELNVADAVLDEVAGSLAKAAFGEFQRPPPFVGGLFLGD
jgi:hypothetical protein